ncbi:MAG: 2-C-methyl-D-erythritol 4-phosphate cytidylyltransferase [Planctomycetes bacterium]|nr:2-C-methyl-D-erythritol 4-phosphate cytidylyltransferase [Planctomycetota bacterium]
MPPPSLPRSTAILVAAGASQRLQARDESGLPSRKPFVLLEGQTVLEHTCAAFARVEAIHEIVIVGHREDLPRLGRLAASSPVLAKVSQIVPGGEMRSDSVAAGVAAASAQSVLVAIHDVARPLVRPATIERALEVALEHGSALVAVPVTDTIKTSSDGLHSESTLDRSVLWCAQTPQVFRRTSFQELLARARAEGFRPTDDCAIWEKYAGPVPLVRGDSGNFKLTTNEDLELAAAILRARRTEKAQGA